MENYTAKCDMNQCQWQYQENGVWKNYSQEDHVTIESGFVAKASTVKVNRGYSRYNRRTIDLKARTEKYGGYGSTIKIRRWLKMSLAELREFRNRADRENFMKKSSNASKLKALFKKYEDPDYDPEEDEEPYIGQEGIIEIASLLKIDAAKDIEILILSWLMDCDELGLWTENQFYLGMARLGATSIAHVKKKIPMFKSMIASADKYKEFYTWCFHYFKETSKKGLTKEMAAAAWGLILQGKCPLLPELVEFMEEYDRGISIDTWMMMLDFSREVKRDLTGWNEIYPPFYDDFVEWLGEEKGIEVPHE